MTYGVAFESTYPVAGPILAHAGMVRAWCHADRFVSACLAPEQMKPAGQADAHTCRRKAVDMAPGAASHRSTGMVCLAS